MTALELRGMLVITAEDHIGFNEADGSHREIIDAYNKITPLPRGYKMTYSDPWCAAFVSAMGAAAGLGDLILPECSCDAMINLYKAKGLWQEADCFKPKIGDIVMYDWEDSGLGDNRGSADHVGIVYAVGDKKLTIIEGNISNAVGFRELNIDGKYIRGYCLPDYDGAGGALSSGSVGEVKVPTEAAKSQPKATVEVKLPVIYYGDKNNAVEAMQQLLMGKGFGVGIDGADGEYGPKTKNALTKFQTDRGLASDGICGKDTWSELLGI